MSLLDVRNLRKSFGGVRAVAALASAAARGKARSGGTCAGTATDSPYARTRRSASVAAPAGTIVRMKDASTERVAKGLAAVRDVLSVLGRRFPLLEVEILPVLVQGSGAAPQSIAKAASERSRSLFWPAVTNSWPATSGSTASESCCGEVTSSSLRSLPSTDRTR